MKAICKIEARDNNGKKVMAFTIGKEYKFSKSLDPEGWETKDDNGNKEVFFAIGIMFDIKK